MTIAPRATRRLRGEVRMPSRQQGCLATARQPCHCQAVGCFCQAAFSAVSSTTKSVVPPLVSVSDPVNFTVTVCPA